MNPLPLPPNATDALLIVDMQQFFFSRPERRLGLDFVIANIQRLIERFDQRGWPVVHVFTAYKADGSDWELKMKASATAECIMGTDEAAFLPQIPVLPHHWQIRKTRYSGFFKTDLADRLHSARVDRVLVCGAYTHYCVNATVFDAYAHDFIPGLVTDAVISHLPDESRVMLDRMGRNGYHLLTIDEYIIKDKIDQD